MSDKALCERLARAMGWTTLWSDMGHCQQWYSPGLRDPQWGAPVYDTEPAASYALQEWLVQQKWVLNVIWPGNPDHRRVTIEFLDADGKETHKTGRGDTVAKALALAVDAALKVRQQK